MKEKGLICCCDWEIDLALGILGKLHGTKLWAYMASLVSTKNDGHGLGPA
jgi:hypothetical protein